ncbi:MAG: flagellar export protein FliJ [Opitutaceae bacterium]|nr:flagellar export protein FliJ [Opitutaceae bacterium]
MAKFQFKFMTLLAHHHRVEDQRQRELAQRLRTRMIFHDQIREMQDTIRGSKQSLADGLVGQVDLTRVGQFARYSGHAAMRARQIVVRLAGVEKEIEEARKVLLEATMKRKSLELLREKHEAEWNYEQNRRETNDLDELATTRYARQMMMGGAS